MVFCYLDLPLADARFDSVLMTTLMPAAWDALVEWSRSKRHRFPRLARLLTGPLPVKVSPADIAELFAECEQIEVTDEPRALPTALTTVATVIRRAAEQRGAWLRLAPIRCNHSNEEQGI